MTCIVCSTFTTKSLNLYTEQLIKRTDTKNIDFFFPWQEGKDRLLAFFKSPKPARFLSMNKYVLV